MKIIFLITLLSLSLNNPTKPETLKYVAVTDPYRFLEIDSNTYKEYHEYGCRIGIIQQGAAIKLENDCYRLSVFHPLNISIFEFDSISTEIRDDYRKSEKICLGDTITFLNEKFVKFVPVKTRRKSKRIITG